jgi:hypothetical protein
MRYRHTQFGWITVGTCGAVLVLFGCLPLPARVPREAFFVGPMLVILVVILLFGALTVEVDDTTVLLRFGIGLVRKHLSLADVASCRSVRNKWWWGWGIRLTPGGWLYNVSGLDAVELVLKNGKKFRIGTDEPRQLAEFIEAKLKQMV